jgi:outer membrane protein assembly factor BamB
MKRKITIFLTVIFLTALITGCSGSASTTASGWASLTTDGETAFVAFNTQIHAVNLANGTERWSFPSDPDPKISFYAAPTLTTDGKLIVGGYNNILYQLDAQTGQGAPFFEEAEGRYIGPAMVTSDMVFAPSADHFLYALDFQGRKVWQQETGEPLWARPATNPDCDCVYLASMDHKVYAYEINSGQLLWESPDLGGAIVGTPAVSQDEVVYVGTFANEMIALDAESGREIWRFQANNWIWAGPAIYEDLLFFGDLSGTFFALERENGVVRWQVQPGGAIVGTPLVTNDGIYFTTGQGSLVCVNPEGTIRWNQPLGDSLHAGPIATDDTILIATSNPENLLIAVDFNGVQRWSFGLEK